MAAFRVFIGLYAILQLPRRLLVDRFGARQVFEKARDAHLIAGVYCPNSTFAKRYQSLGYQFMTLSNDKAMIREAARTILGQMA